MSENQTVKKKKKRRKYLARRISRIIVFVALIIFIVSTFLNWAFMNTQSFALLGIYGESQIVNAVSWCDIAGDFEAYKDSVLEVYHSIPEEVRANPSSLEYQKYFSKFTEDEFFLSYAGICITSMDPSILNNYMLTVYDEETSALVCLFNLDAFNEEDPEREFRDASAFSGALGGWISMSPEEYRSMVSPKDSPKWNKNDRLHSSESLALANEILNDDTKAVVGTAVILIPEALITVATIGFLIIYFLVLGIIIVIIVLLSNIILRRRLTVPIKKISAAAETYTANKTGMGPDTEPVFGKLDIHTRDELEELSTVMAAMERDIGIYEVDLADAAAKQERIQADLDVGTKIQTSMLPDPAKLFTDRNDFKIYASMKPAREVGGDFYDFFLIDEDHLGLVIADVSGKGIPAALVMMSSMIMINELSALGLSPSAVLERANAKLCASNKVEMFVTVWFGILDLKSGLLTAANAGHEYPAICRAGEDFELLHDKHGFVVGGMEGIRYKEYSLTLPPGSTLFVYTDGVPEATSKDLELYGTDRMIRALNQVKDCEPADICKAVHDDVDAFVGEAPQFDDLTMLCVHYAGPGQDGSPEQNSSLTQNDNPEQNGSLTQNDSPEQNGSLTQNDGPEQNDNTEQNGSPEQTDCREESAASAE